MTPKKIYLAIMLASSTVPAFVHAQGAATAIEEVTVTAQKREQSMQDVPAAVSAMGEAQLEVNGVTSLDGLNAMAPNVIVQPFGLFPQTAVFSIRGLTYNDISSDKDPTVGVVLDGVNQARNLGTLIDMFDVERIEVLRGPQGTLFGRNNIGGVVNVVTKKPGDEFEGSAKFTAGNYGRMEMRGAVDIPLSETTAARISAISRTYDGHFKNGANGEDFGAEDVQAVRAKVLYQPSDNFDLLLTLDDITERTEGAGVTNLSRDFTNAAKLGYPADNDGDPYLVYSDLDPVADLDTTGATLEMNWHLGQGSVTSISGWRQTSDTTATDYDGEDAVLFDVHRDQDFEMFNQEVRFASELDGPLNYVTGLFYSKAEFDLDNFQNIYLPLFGVPVPVVTQGSVPAAQKSESSALFFQGDYDINDQLTATVGGRYTSESKSFINKFFDDYLDKSWDNFSPMARLNYQWSDDLMVYAGYTTGFRSGVFNGRAGTATSVGPTDEETVQSWEAGFKSDLVDNRLRLNAAVFYSNYDEMQMTFMRQAPGTTTFETVTDNAGAATIQGLEVELTALLTDRLSVQFSGGYLDANIDEFNVDLNGNGIATDNSYFDLPFAPPVTATLQATYNLPVSYGLFVFHGSANYSDEYVTSALKTDDLFYRDAATMYNANVSFSDLEERYTISLYGKNLTDETLISNAFTLGANYLDAGSYSAPRMYGAEFRYNF